MGGQLEKKVFPLLSSNAEALKLYLLSNHENAGDHNQALGVLTAFEKLSGENISFEDLNTKITSPLEIKDRVEKDLPGKKIIIIGACEGGIDGITDLPANPNLMICLTSHMLLERYKNPSLLKKVTFITLPTHVSTEVKEQLGSKLIETIGVAHNRQPEEADKVYQEWSKQELPACKTYVGIILGGDTLVPGPEKQTKLFTENNAIKLVEYVSQSAKKACVLILNGPRTGKHDLNKNEILTVHRRGYPDHITNIFKRELAKEGIKNIKVFDFQHDVPENKAWVLPYNAWDLVIGALRATNGELIVPGDSTSVISEAVDTLPPGKVLVYEDGSMNEVHKAHLTNELAMGRISILKNYYDIVTPRSHSQKTPLNAAIVIAQRLWKKCLKSPLARRKKVSMNPS